MVPTMADDQTKHDDEGQVKHQKMLERMRARELEQQQRRSAQNTPSITFQSEFSDMRKEVETAISLGENGGELCKQQLEKGSTTLSKMRASLNNAATFLPAYDIRHSQEVVDKLYEQLTTLSNKVNPPKAFSFRSRTKTQQQMQPTQTVSPQTPPASACQPESQHTLNGLSEKQGTTIYKTDDSSDLGKRQDFLLEKLVDCNIFITQTFTALRITNSRQCRIFCAPVDGSVQVERCEECLLCFGARQVRIHHTKNCHFFLYAKTNPIIEFCSELRFSPYCFEFPGRKEAFQEEQNKWNKVEDFSWLKSGQSPNWAQLEGSNTVRLQDANKIEGELPGLPASM